jgi:hypothetical protein
MKNTWKWVLGLSLVMLLLSALPFLRFFLPQYGGYRMMGNGFGWHMPMMYGGFGMMLWMWLGLLGLIVLIGLGIAWIVKSLAVRKG